jgi:hypothetical protein
LESDPEYASEVKIGRSVFKRYSHKMISRVKEILRNESVDVIWDRSGMGSKGAVKPEPQ